MRYSVLGFSQRALLEHHLGLDEALILRWFCDFDGSDRMKTFLVDGKAYAWVDYTKLLTDLPIAGSSTKTLARKLQALMDCGILERTVIQSQGGKVSAYRLLPEFETLVNDSSQKADEEAIGQNCPLQDKNVSQETKMIHAQETEMSFAQETNLSLGISSYIDKLINDNTSADSVPYVEDNKPYVEDNPPSEYSIILKDGTWYSPSSDSLKDLSAAYPGVDVRSELLKARMWSVANPALRKTRRGALRFINGWLARAKPSPLAYRGPKKTSYEGGEVAL